MLFSPHFFRIALLAAAGAAVLPARAAEPTRIVFQNGRSVLLSAVTLQGDKLVTTVSADGFTQGQAMALETADHVFGERPTEVNPAIALLLTGKPAEAQKMLEPVLSSQRPTAKIPGNFWLEAAKAALVAYAVQGNTAKVNEIGKEISDATPAQGIDPFVSLGKALLLPLTTKVSDRDVALKDLTTDNLPSDVCAYASFYRAELLKSVKKNANQAEAIKQEQEILETYLSVSCLFPTGGLILNGVAELRAAEILAGLGRREEAIALLNSASYHAAGTLVAADANKRLESLK